MYITRLCKIARVCQKRLDLIFLKRTAPKIFLFEKEQKNVNKTVDVH